MRLLEIEVHNFGSFGQATLDLRGVNAAVVVGQNGAGKSTLCVDAPLWALFGRCRTGADQMLRLGADEMSVSVTFLLNGQLYRVIRKRSLKTKAGRSDFELQIADSDTEWRSASGARMADTQEKVINLLNSDYELLIATGILVQGQADRFSRATSTERKAILAQILRLDQYGPLRQAATRHLTIADAKHGEKSSQLAGLDEEASTIPSLEARQTEIHAVLVESNKAIEQLEQHQQDLTTKKAAVAAELEQLHALPAQIRTLEAQRSDLLKDSATKMTRRERAAKILSNRATIETKVKEEDDRRQLDHQLEEERATLTEEATELGNALNDVRLKLSDGIVLEREILKAKADVDQQVRTYQADTDRLQRDIETDERASTLLKQVPCGADLQGHCQFTLQAVEAERRLPTLREVFGARLCTPGHEATIAPESYAQFTALTKTYLAWAKENYAADAHGLEERIGQVSRKQNDCEMRRVANRTSLTDLAKFTILVPELDAAEREMLSVDQDLARIAVDLARIDQDLDRLQARQADRATLTTEHGRLANEWQQDATYLSRLRSDGQTAIGRLKELELEIKQAQDAGRQAEQLRQECASLQIDGRHFQALATAYAQIPVLILESSIPLLEEEANRILAKISSSGLRVTFQTQKTLKSRDGLAETLDITVRDVFGERLLECFSGGERARVDLAIRIGLSRLLANRAGARLETLVVDEAFAAVDREGVEQLVECLPMLSQEVPLILFVTHDESFKSSIAQQILVTKGPSGSQVEVVA